MIDRLSKYSSSSELPAATYAGIFYNIFYRFCVYLHITHTGVAGGSGNELLRLKTVAPYNLTPLTHIFC